MADLKLIADSGGGTVSLKAPAATTSNAAVTLKLPVADGSANQLLKTDGSGQLGWATDSTTDSSKLPLTGGTITGDLTVETTAGGDFLFDNSDNALLVGDNTSIKFGAGTDFRLSSDGTADGGALLAAGEFRIASSGSSKAINIMKGTSAYLGRFITDGAVELYYNGSKKAETVTGGFTISGTCTATAYAGDGSSLTGVASATADGCMYENALTISNNYTVAATKGAHSVGPITNNAVVTLNGVWVIS